MPPIPDKLYHLIYKIAHAGLVAFAFVFRPATKGVNIAVRLNGKILIIKNSYYHKYTVPGGYVKPGENPRHTAVRELREEVGLSAVPNQLRHVGAYRFNAMYKRETVDLFEFCLRTPLPIEIDNREVIWAGYLSPENAGALNLSMPVRQYVSGMNLGN